MKNILRTLRKTLFTVFLVSMLCGALLKQAISQENEIRYALVEYFKVKPENSEKYLEFVKDFWGPVQHGRIEQNKILGWRIFKILFAGSSDEYNYVSAVFFHDFGAIENVRNIDFQKVYPGKNTNDIMNEFVKVGDLVKTEYSKRI